MVTPPIADSNGLAAVLDAPYAVVLLSVPWSCPERTARSAFLSAAEELASPERPTPILCAVLDEEAAPVQRWLASLGIEAFTGSGPLGAGSVLWLTRGRVASFVLSGLSLRPRDIVLAARSLRQADA